jgi:hypothetical protein
MPNINLIGTEPDQIPTNADLGTLAFQDQDYVNVGNLIVATVDVTTEARFARFSTANATITGGSLSGVSIPLVSTLAVTNFSSGNALITGGSITGGTGAFTTLTATNFSSGNVTSITGGAGTFVATNFSTANALITGGSITGITGAASTLTATNFSSANAEITGSASHIGTDTSGAVSRVANVYSSLGNYTNFSTANAVITGGSITGGTGAFSTLVATNFSSGNVTSITGGAGTFVATNFSSGNALITGGSITGGTGAFTTLTATNFSSGNVTSITGGAGTFVATNFSTANALITGGSITGGTGAFTTLTATNFSSGNVTSITGGAGTFVATNFSSGNISITGGNIILAPGIAGKAPLRFSTGGALTSTAAAGQLEYTTLFHGTTQGTERGLVPTPQIFVLNADRGLATVATTQTLFNQTFKVTAGTRYYYEAFISISKTNASANTLQYAIVVATAVIAAHEYSVISKVAATRQSLTSLSQMSNRITTGFDALVAVSGASAASAATFDAHIQGYFDITTGGTIDPQIALATNAPTVPILLAQSYWLMYPVGVTSANTSIQ